MASCTRPSGFVPRRLGCDGWASVAGLFIDARRLPLVCSSAAFAFVSRLCFRLEALGVVCFRSGICVLLPCLFFAAFGFLLFCLFGDFAIGLDGWLGRVRVLGRSV